MHLYWTLLKHAELIWTHAQARYRNQQKLRSPGGHRRLHGLLLLSNLRLPAVRLPAALSAGWLRPSLSIRLCHRRPTYPRTKAAVMRRQHLLLLLNVFELRQSLLYTNGGTNLLTLSVTRVWAPRPKTGDASGIKRIVTLRNLVT